MAEQSPRQIVRIPLIEAYDRDYGFITDAFVEPTPARKALMARPSFQQTFEIGPPLGLIGSYPNLIMDAELAFSVNFSNPGAAPSKISSQIHIAYVFHGVNAANGNIDYYVGLYNITSNDLLSPGTYYLSSVTAANSASFTGAQIATACNPLSSLVSTSLVSGGTGYFAGEELTIGGGTFESPIVIEAQVVDGSGTILAFVVLSSGIYGTTPPNPVSQSSSTGSGTGATFNLAFTLVYGVVLQWALPSSNYAFVGVDVSDSSFVFSKLPPLPANCVASITDLSGYNFVLSTDGNIWNTEVGDPTTYNGLNFTQAFSKQATNPVTLSVHQGYLSADGGDEIRFFQVTGAINGSSVSPILNVEYGIGPISAQTVATSNEYMGFVGSADGTGVPVYMFVPNSQAPERVSYPYLENQFGLATITTANFLTFRGQLCFVVNTAAGAAYIFDFISKLWYLWNPFEISAGVTALTNTTIFDNATYSVQANLGTLDLRLIQVFTAGLDVKLDGTTSVYVPQIVTKPIDFESDIFKQWESVALIGDRTPTSVLCAVSYSNDGINFSTPRSIDMMSSYPVSRNMGMDRRRFWKTIIATDWLARIQSLEMAVTAGDM